MAGLTRLPFRVRLRVPVGDVVEREGWLVQGDAGWGEYSPLPSWSQAERAAAEHAAEDAAAYAFPPALRERVEVNCLVPRIAPAEAAQLARDSGCRSVKIKVGDADGEARVRAVREALPQARLRLDANGAWSVEEAADRLRAFVPFDIEFVEDPVASMEDLAALRRTSPMPVAAESCVRTVADARRLADLAAADVLVVKPQRIGGVQAALDAAAEVGAIPVVPSSALETSIGLAAVLAVAAALPDLPYAAGIGTALLLEEDVVEDPLLPEDGMLEARRPTMIRGSVLTGSLDGTDDDA